MAGKNITNREAVILTVLETGELFGREIRDAAGKLTGGQMPYGSLYTTLDRMERSGLIKGRDGEPNPELGGNKRRFYKVTGHGRSCLDEFRQAVSIFAPRPSLG